MLSLGLLRWLLACVLANHDLGLVLVWTGLLKWQSGCLMIACHFSVWWLVLRDWKAPCLETVPQTHYSEQV